MKKSILTLITIFLFIVKQASACDCDTRGAFLTRGAKADIVIRCRVLDYTQGGDQPRAMLVTVTETFKGTIATNEIEVWGDNGYQCRPCVTQFPTNTEWILGINTNNWPGEGGYFISICGAYWLKYSNGMVSGRIHTDEESVLPVTDFKEALKKDNSQPNRQKSAGAP